MSLPLLQHLEGRLGGLSADRQSFFLHWRELGDYILPRRYKWIITANQANKGSPINGLILDETGTIACRTLASGMLSGIVSPTRPWFRLRMPGFDLETTNPVSLWLSDCEHRMMRVFQESNFYNSMATVFVDLVVFGTAPMLIYEDYEDVIRCYNLCAGEYYLANSDRLAVDSCYRKFAQTVTQVVQWFGLKNCSDAVKRLYAAGGAGLSQEVIVAHCIEPNTDDRAGLPKHFQYRELYWEFGVASSGQKAPTFLAKRGFNELPGIFPRWDITSNDAYGRSPAMDALGSIKQLQQETKRKAQAIDKMVNPPMLADIQLKNQPASMLPGGVTYISGASTANVGFKPVYQVMPPVQEIMMDIQEVQARIRTILFNDLFLMISQLDTVRTATEIDARKSEQLIQLGPVLERFGTEGLDPAIDRTFNIMMRGGLFLPPPPEIEGMELQITYESMLAEAQRAVATTGIERVLTMAGSIAAIQPDVMDNIDLDEALDEYARLLSVAPTIIRSREQLAALRQQRQEQEQQAQALEASAAAVQAGKVLSETKVRGGGSVLDMALQGGAPI